MMAILLPWFINGLPVKIALVLIMPPAGKGLFALVYFNDRSSYSDILQRLADALLQMISLFQKELVNF